MLIALIVEGVVLVALAVAVYLMWKWMREIAASGLQVTPAPDRTEIMQVRAAVEQVQLLVGKQGNRLSEHIKTTSHR